MLSSILIALSLLLLLGLGIAALFLAGGTRDSTAADRMEDDEDEKDEFTS